MLFWPSKAIILSEKPTEKREESNEGKHGRLEYHLMPLALKCSVCKQRVPYTSGAEFNYCPKCGAKMDLSR